MLRSDPSGQQLATIGFHQVEEDFLGQTAVAGSASRQEEQRILLADRIRIFDFVKQFASVLELRLELSSYFGADGVTAIVNSGTDCGPQVAGQSAEVTVHLADTLLDDAFDGPTPARVEDADSAAFCVHQDDRQAIGGQNSQQQTWLLRDQAVAGKC